MLRVIGNLIRGAGSITLGLALGTLLTEATLRVFEGTPLWRVMPVAEVSLYAPSPTAGYAHRPGAGGVWLREQRVKHQVNSQGLLDRKVAPEKPAGAYRVFVAGDSLTEALQVRRPDTFVRLSENQLRRDGLAVQLVNLGIAGATPAVMAARTASFASLAPDLLVYLVGWSEFKALTGDDSAYAAYTRHGNGWQRTDRFRRTFSYRFRASPAGQWMYRLLDTSRVAALANSRKNIGWLAELELAGARHASTKPTCASAASLGAAVQVWSAASDSAPAYRVRAFLEDVEAQVAAVDAAATIIVNGLSDQCPNATRARSDLVEEMRAQASNYAIPIVDWDAQMGVDSTTRRALNGFGITRGYGHLNEVGHKRYADALTRTIVDSLE